MPRTDPFEVLLGAACRLICIEPTDAVSPLVFQAKRVDTAALLRAGWVELPGDSELAKLLHEGSKEGERKIRMASAKNEVQRKKLLAKFAEEDKAEQDRFLAALVNDPTSMDALQRRCDAWVIASVDGVGIPRDHTVRGILDGTPAQLCEEGPEGYIKPCRFGIDVPVTILAQQDRVTLGTLLQVAFGVSKEIRPLSQTSRS